MTQEEEAEMQLKLTTLIKSMDSELADRFKAIFCIQKEIREIDDETREGIRELEIQFEHKYKDIYSQREKFINGKVKPDQELIKQFD